MKKLAIVLLLAVLAMSVGFSAAQDTTIPSELPSGVTITYWHEWGGGQLDAINALVDDFNANNEWGITVDATSPGGSGDVQNAVQTGITTGDLPNLTGAVFTDTAQGLYTDGVLVPLDDYMNDPTWGLTDEEKANIDMSIIDVNRSPGEPFNNQLLAWPTGVSADVLSVNMTMLNQLGFDKAPETLDDFRAVSCAANDLTTADGGDVQGFALRIDSFDMFSFIVSNGGTVFDNATQQYDFTDDNTIEVLQFFQDLYNDGCAYIAEGYNNTGDFSLGLNPMAVGSTAGIPYIQGPIDDNNLDINWINTTTPWKDDHRTIQVFLRSMSVLTGTPEQQLASWLFLKYLASPQAQITWTNATQYIPYTKSGLDAIDSGDITISPQLDEITTLMNSGDVQLWAAPQAPGSQQVFFGVSDTLVADITTGGMDVMAAAQKATDAANQALADAQSNM